MKNLIFQSYAHFDPAQHVLVSMENIKIYAKRYGAEYQFVKVSEPDDWKYRFFLTKLQILDPKFDSYDNILWLDSDILAHPKAKNIFEHPAIKDSDLLIKPEWKIDPTAIPGRHGLRTWIANPELLQKYNKHNIPLTKHAHLFSNGVALWTKKARQKARDEWEDWREWVDDETDYDMKLVLLDAAYVSAMCLKYDMKVSYLDHEWERDPYCYKSVPYANFYHFRTDEGKKNMYFFEKKLIKGVYI